MRLLITLIITCALLSCNRKKPIPPPFSTGMLANQNFTINSAQDTALETLHGSVIRIKAGSFNVDGNIQIEIKEAFTPAEIFSAGLTTESNGKPLRSGGMIYINATYKNKTIELLKPISVAIPNTYFDSAMKVYKGVENDIGNINWIEPVLTDTTSQSNVWNSGRSLFRQLCASCHNIFVDMTGPALMNIENQFPWTDRNLLYSFIRNPYKLADQNADVRKRLDWAPGSMPLYSDLSTRQIDDILDYIKNKSVNPTGNEVQNSALIIADTSGQSIGVDSVSNRLSPCKDDTVYYPVKKQEISFFNEDVSTTPILADTLPIVSNKEGENKLPDTANRNSGIDDWVSTTGAYEFNVKAFGWYNIDAEMEGYQGTSVIKVFANVQVEIEMDIKVYLFCPDRKILSVGNEKNGSIYSFNKINGGVPLFIGDRAVLFVFGSVDDRIFYGISEFKITNEQSIKVKVVESSEKEIRDALLERQMNGVDLGLEKKEKRIIKKNCDEQPANMIKDTTANK